MLINVAAVVFGLVVLVFSADRFIAGAAATARRLGVPALLVGLTVVGIGTSLPEMVVGLIASLQDKAGLAIGNVIGSNITNIALVAGSAALITPLAVHSSLVRRELPAVLAASILALVLALDGQYSVVDGCVLLAGLVLVLAMLARAATADSEPDPIAAEIQTGAAADMPTGVALGWLVLGLVLLPISSQALVWGASNIAAALGVSELVIGLTIVAVGTSLPELATSLAAVSRREHDLVLGNVIGSNLFNLLAVLPMPALLAPGILPTGALSRDLPVMLALTVVLFALCWGRGARIGRIAGLGLLAAFVVYEFVLYLARFQ